MADVLGKYSFLDTPDVNGADLITSLNPVLTGTASLTLPAGTTAQRPVSPVAGMTRFNTTLNLTEFYDGTTWIQTGASQTGIVQTVIGNISSASANNQIPYDNTVPQIGEGFQLWTTSFTPLFSTSTIVIVTSAFYTVASNADIYTTLAYFQSGSNSAIFAQLAGFSTSNGEGRGFSTTATFSAGSTAARTYSCRMGPSANVTVFYCQGTGGQAYGGTTNSGRYIIQEIAS
jgi:hypothetical protein